MTNSNHPPHYSNPADPATRDQRSLLIEVRDLRTRFHIAEGTVHAVNGISFKLHERETLAVVGESGCGKSVSMMSIMGLIAIPRARSPAAKRFSAAKTCSSSPKKRWNNCAAARSRWFSRTR
ncbi:MAG: ATP-binding cassette domain-containing protein [Anaerolineales bacterium]|nr:ATP-binding cassette domain-containing protein [Anaerolineales bacterium]